jgi:uncharacterized protein YraI
MKTRFRVLMLICTLGLLVGILPAQLVGAAPSEQRANVAAPIMIVNTSFLNIRTGPGIQYATLVTVVGGTTLPVLGVAEDRVWYQVSTVVGVGWVNSQYVLARGNFANVPLAEAPPLIDERAVIISDDTAVDFGFSSQREWGISVTVDQPLRYEPSINSAQIQGLGPDPRLIFTVVGATFADGVPWIQIQLPDGKVGWLEQTKVIFRPFACELSAVQITQNVDLKKGPDGSGPDTAVYVSAGQEAYLLNRIDNQFQVELIDGAMGWVDVSFIAVRDRNSVYSQYCANGGFAGRSTGLANSVIPDGVARASIPRVIINTGYLNIRSGPGAQYTSVIALPGGTELSVLGRAADGVWYLVQGPFGQGWMNIEFVLFRGDGSRLPIIRNAVGEIATPTGSISRPTVTLYAAPNLTLGVVGTLTQGTVVDVVARTEDFMWVQVSTELGFGWVQADFITLAGDTGMIPVVS